MDLEPLDGKLWTLITARRYLAAAVLAVRKGCYGDKDEKESKVRTNQRYVAGGTEGRWLGYLEGRGFLEKANTMKGTFYHFLHDFLF